MHRRDFYSSLAKVSTDVLKNNTYFGDMDGVSYTFVPATKADAPTLIVVNINLHTPIYTEHFNLIFLKNWPSVGHNFWTKVFARHDLVSEAHLLSWTVPSRLPSFVKKTIQVSRDASKLSSRVDRPILMMQDGGNMGVSTLPAPDVLPEGSDIFVGFINGLNKSDSPAYARMQQFLN
jgi:hypothetical protein